VTRLFITNLQSSKNNFFTVKDRTILAAQLVISISMAFALNGAALAQADAAAHQPFHTNLTVDITPCRNLRHTFEHNLRPATVYNRALARRIIFVQPLLETVRDKTMEAGRPVVCRNALLDTIPRKLRQPKADLL